MKTITTFAAAMSLSIAAAGHAAADSHHGHSGGPLANDSGPSAPQGEMMHGMMRMMMPMMMQMHGQMMDAGPAGGLSMMDGDMMRMMMAPGGMGDGLAADPEPEAARSAMLARLAEFDADGDGKLSLAEFEALRACPGGIWIGVWHPFVSGRLSRWQRVERMIEYMLGTGDVWFAPLEEIAAHVASVEASGEYAPRVDRLPYHSENQVPEELQGKA